MDHIANINGLEMDPAYLLDDVVLIAFVFDDDESFKKAITQVVHTLHLIIEKRSIGQALSGNLTGWYSFHFKSKRVNKQPADLRCVYTDTGQSIQVREFGHRHMPIDIFRRLYGR